MIQWGPKAGQRISDAEFLEKIARETGKTPTAVATRPLLNVLEMPCFDAFLVLHGGRGSTGFGPAPIALTEIQAYAELMQIPPGDDRRDLVWIIRKMDRHYLEQVMKK